MLRSRTFQGRSSTRTHTNYYSRPREPAACLVPAVAVLDVGRFKGVRFHSHGAWSATGHMSNRCGTHRSCVARVAQGKNSRVLDSTGRRALQIPSSCHAPQLHHALVVLFS